MKQKHHERVDSFLNEFNHLYDGVLRRIEFRFTPSEIVGRANLTFSVCRPGTEKTDDGWLNLRLAIMGVEEFSVRESSKESCRVLSSGLHVGVFDELVYFDFAPYSLSPKGLEDYRRSGFYIAGREFSWKVETYAEQVPSNKKRERLRP